jgi:hypothetical protein
MVGVGMVIYVELLSLPGKLCHFGEKVSNGRLLSGFHSSSTVEGLMCGSLRRMTNTSVIS